MIKRSFVIILIFNSALLLATAKREISDTKCFNGSYRVNPLGVNIYQPSRRRCVISSCATGGMKEEDAVLSEREDVEVVSTSASKIASNLAQGALLRIASDITGGTPLESVKTRVTVTTEGPLRAFRNIISEGGIGSLWSGTPSRTIEGALMGALFLAGSAGTKKMVIANGGGPTMAAICGGFVGGIAQAAVMTPAGLVFTSLNVNKNTPGYENENFLTVTRRIVKEKGVGGMFAGGIPMCIRQSTNWASRSGFTEIARTQFRMSQYGLWGEIGSGIIGGLGSCWNTPVETVRVLLQQDVSRGKEAKKMGQYCELVIEEAGVPGLFRGVTPRGIQAIWQTVFMVVVPNMLGV